MNGLVILIDCLIIASILLSAILWLSASQNRLRRISRNEDLDAADINRIVTAMNRTQILNSRAALATACSAVLTGLRVAIDVLAITAEH